MGVVWVVLLAAAPPGWGQQATIEDLIISSTGENLLLYCTVQGSFSEELNRAILSGVPTTFTFRIELHRKRSILPDVKITEIVRHHTLKHDTLKNDFTVSLEGEENEIHTVKEFFRAKRIMTEVNGVKVARLSDLEPKHTYSVRIKAELNKVRLPLYLHYIFFFVSLWDFETAWHEVYFTF